MREVRGPPQRLWVLGHLGRRGDELEDLGENEARQKAMDLNVVFDQYGERSNADRREVRPPMPVESATWQAAGELDYWVRERGEWWGRVRGPDGHQFWIRAADLRRHAP